MEEPRTYKGIVWLFQYSHNEYGQLSVRISHHAETAAVVAIIGMGHFISVVVGR